MASGFSRTTYARLYPSDCSQIRRHPGGWVSPDEKVADHGHRRRTCGDGRGSVLERDAADGHYGPSFGAVCRRGHQVETDRLIARGLRPRAKYGTDSDVVDRLADGSVDLIDRVRRIADDAGSANDRARGA